MNFEDRLLGQLKVEMAQRSAQGRPPAPHPFTTTRWILATAAVAGIAAAATAGLPSLNGSNVVAHAVTTNPDGTVTIRINDPDDPEQLETELIQHGVPADVLETGGRVCLDDPFGPVGPNELISKPNSDIFIHSDDGTGTGAPNAIWTVNPRRLHPGDVLLLRINTYQRQHLRDIRVFLVDRPVPPCTLVDQPSHFPPR
jgi:hypothetical protein